MIKWNPPTWECDSNCPGLTKADVATNEWVEPHFPHLPNGPTYNVIGWRCLKCGKKAFQLFTPVGGPMTMEQVFAATGVKA